MKKISLTRLKIIGVIILESCQDLQIYLKFGFKSRTWIVLLNVRSWRVVHPRKKNDLQRFHSTGYCTNTYHNSFLSNCSYNPPPPPPISDRYIFLLSGNRIISLTCRYWWSTCADPEYFFQGKGTVLRIILLYELSNFECSMAARGMSWFPATPWPSRF